MNIRRTNLRVTLALLLGYLLAVLPSIRTHALEPTNALPSVQWIRPTNGLAISPGSSVLMTARATDPDGTIVFVEFFTGSLSLGRGNASTNSFYNLMWTNVSAGIHQLRAMALDNAGGRSTSSPVQIVISSGTNSPPTNVPPLVTWIRPTNGLSFAAGIPILMTARATDADGGVAFVDFFANSIHLGRVTGSRTNYSLTWSNAPPGTFQLHAEAVDNAGATGVSAAATIVVNGATNSLPRLEILRVSVENGTTLMVYGQPGRTHVVECSPDTTTWIPISTNVMPATVCPVCPFTAVSDLSVTVEGNRFYRVVEVP